MTETISSIVSTARRGRDKPALYVGLAGDAPRSAPARISLAGCDRVELVRGEGRTVTRASAGGVDSIRVMLPDARMSGQHARLSRLGGAWVIEDVGSKNGTWIGGQRATRHTLGDGDAFVIGHTAIVFRTAGGEQPDIDEVTAPVAPGLSTLSPALATRFGELARASQSSVVVEITGESGTGKELVARAIHTISKRPGRFVAMNCGALPDSLLTAELFGHAKGAFTGAEGEREGLVRSAHTGTLFLDEIAELSPSAQAGLLRTLQEGEVLPLGADRPVKVDVRIVTATHKRLDGEVEANRFRADLRARLLGFDVTLPALRDRREDLGLLVATLLDRLAPGREITFAADAVAALYTYPWPLNIRELERALSVALAVAQDRIELDHLPASPRGRSAPAPAIDVSALSAEDQALRTELAASLARHDGNTAAVARELGKDRTQIRRWMKRFGLSRDDDAT